MQAQANQYRLYLPLTDNAGRFAPRVHSETEARLIKLFGGVTVWDARGAWIGDSGKTYHDAIRIYEAFAFTTQGGRWAFSMIANVAGLALEQESVMVIVAGQVDFIKPALARLQKTRDTDKYKPTLIPGA